MVAQSAVYDEALTMYIVLLPEVGCLARQGCGGCSSVLFQLQRRSENF